MGVGSQRHAPAAFTPGKDPVPIVQEAGWALGPVWIDAENLAPTGIRSTDLAARSKLLYQLHYPSPRCKVLPQKEFSTQCKQYASTIVTHGIKTLCSVWGVYV